MRRSNLRVIAGEKLPDALLARLLCCGVRPSDECLQYWRTLAPIEKGFIHGVSLSLEGKYIINTALLDSMVEGGDALDVHFRHGESYVDWGGSFALRPVRQPAAVWQRDKGGRLIGDYMRLHSPTTLFLIPVRECIFGAIGRPCEFCTYEMRRPEPLTSSELLNMISIFISDADVIEMAFGGGTPRLGDHGAIYYSNLVRAVVSEFGARCSVELVPPQEDEALDELLSSGVRSLVMSLELWDCDIRARVCPGKAVVTRERYRDAWLRSLDRLGSGTVSSVLLVGIEPVESTMEGINRLIEWGVLPTLIPFRPYDETPMSHHKATSHEDYLTVARYAASRLAQANLSPNTHAGCAGCGGCSLEKFFLS